MNAGLGYGGSCFPKDIRALEYAAKRRNVNPEMLRAVQNVNDSQIDLYIDKLTNKLTNLDGKK